MSGEQPTQSLSEPVVSPRSLDWSVVSPLFLSAAFYLTGLFAVLAPFPLLTLYFKRGRVWALVASVTNGILVGLLGGPVSFLIYLVMVLVLSWTLGEALNRKASVEVSSGLALLGMSLVAIILLFVSARIYHLDLLGLFRAQILDWAEKAGQPLVSDSKLFNPGDFDEWKRSVWIEFLPALGVTWIAMIWANVVLLIKSNPGGIRERFGLGPNFLSQWKAPEILVWPTIVAGAFLIADFGVASDVAWVVFELLMAIYVIHGLSVLSAVLDLWGVQGILRVIGYSCSLVLMFPLVLSLGFFDLWFDFRAKLGQS